MLQNLTGMHALVILAVVILLFGASKLPALAKSVGQSVRILKDESAEKPTDPELTAVALTQTSATAEPAPAPTQTSATEPVSIADQERKAS